MDEAPNNYMDIGHQGLYSSIIPWTNEFDFGEEADLSEIFDMPQEQHVNTNNTSIESSPKHHPNSENVSELPSDGINQENPKTFMPMTIIMEKQCDTSNISRSNQENPKTNDVLLQQPLQKIPILEKHEREASLKSKFTIPNQGSEKMKPKFFMNQPYGLSTSTKVGEQENPTTNGMILPRPKSNILTLEKLKSHLMRSKSMVGHENGIFHQGIDHSGGYEILNSLDNNELPQNTSNTNGGPIRRSPNRTSSRYQPYFGRKIDPNNIEGKLDSCQVAENYNNEENLVGRSSNLVNHSNHNFQHSPAYTHEITNMKFKGVASTGQNFNEYTQGNVYSNQAITSRSLNNRQENVDEAPDQLQPSWAESWNTQDSHFNTTTNWPRGPFQ